VNQKVRLRTHLSINEVEQDLRRVIDSIAQSCKYVSEEIKKVNRRLAGGVNNSGDKQLALDVIADNILLESLKQERSFSIRDFVSEEKDSIVTMDKSNGRYSVAVDPLDGSSLADVNLSVGTIVGIHDGDILSEKNGRSSLAAAMYVLYGPLTTLVYTARKGTHEFVLDTAGNFTLINENLSMEEKGSIYSTGGLRNKWLACHKQFVMRLENDNYKLRYSGGFVPDCNQILLKKGGIFSYPQLHDAQNGKLRLLFELQPMALIFEEAGGRASNGIEDILDIIPFHLDERSPVYLGSREEVKLAREYGVYSPYSFVPNTNA
jgi:fructose-1,6-bisphosphatase I